MLLLHGLDALRHVLLKVVDSFADASLTFIDLSMGQRLLVIIRDLAHKRCNSGALRLLCRIVVNTRRCEFLLAR